MITEEQLNEWERDILEPLKVINSLRLQFGDIMMDEVDSYNRTLSLIAEVRDLQLSRGEDKREISSLKDKLAKQREVIV